MGVNEHGIHKGNSYKLQPTAIIAKPLEKPSENHAVHSSWLLLTTKANKDQIL